MMYRHPNDPWADDPKTLPEDEEEIIIDLDGVLISVSDDGGYIDYVDRDVAWLSDELQGTDLYSDKYPEVILADIGELADLILDLLEPNMPDTGNGGTYEVSADIHLTYEVSNIYDESYVAQDRPDEDPYVTSDYNAENAEVEMLDSYVSNLSIVDVSL